VLIAVTIVNMSLHAWERHLASRRERA